MIEPIMYIGDRFPCCDLFARWSCRWCMPVRPTHHATAGSATPLSMAEIQADKDQLRAEFAMSTRRLEMSVEQLKAKTTSQPPKLAKKRRNQPPEARTWREERPS